MAVIRQVCIFYILVVILFHFGHSYKYADYDHDHNIEELSQAIKNLIHPKYVQGRYPYENKKPTQQIIFDDYNVRPHHDDNISWDKSEKPTSKGSEWTHDKYSNEDHVKYQSNGRYDRNDEADTNSGQGSKDDVIVKNQSNEWYDKNGKVDPNSGYIGKDDVKNENNEGYNKNNEASIDNWQAGYKDNEKVSVPDLEIKDSSIENSKWSNPIDILPSASATEILSSASVSLPDKDNSNDKPIDRVDNDFSTDVSISIENPYNIPLPNKIEQETVKPLDNLPASFGTNLLDSFSNNDINIASGTQLLSLNQASYELNSAVPNVNYDPTLALNSIPSVLASENYQNNGVLYNNGVPYYNYVPNNNAVPYSPYDVPGFSIPSLYLPSNFAPNSGPTGNTVPTANLFNNYFPTNPAYGEFYNNPNLSQWGYETVQLNNGQIAIIPKYWPIFPTNNPFPPTVESKQIFPPNNPFPPTVGSRQIFPPNYPLPPTVESKQIFPPNNPFPPAVGSRQIFPPNNPLPPTVESKQIFPPNNPFPPTVGSRQIFPPNNPLPPTVESKQIFPPNNQIYEPGQNLHSIAPQWLLYNNQYVPFNNSQDYIEGKSDDKQVNLEG